jgi:hypothetical protein
MPSPWTCDTNAQSFLLSNCQTIVEIATFVEIIIRHIRICYYYYYFLATLS